MKEHEKCLTEAYSRLKHRLITLRRNVTIHAMQLIIAEKPTIIIDCLRDLEVDVENIIKDADNLYGDYIFSKDEAL